MVEKSDKIFSILMEGDEVTWQSIIHDLVKSGEIDPWDVDIGLLSTKFLELLTKLKKMDFRISGKVVLAAAILLKIKSNKLMGEEMSHFENLLRQPEEVELLDEYLEPADLNEQLAALERNKEKPKLIPRTPQPRERKVTIFDLIDALQHTLEFRKKKVTREVVEAPEVKAPEHTRDITEIIREVFSNIKQHVREHKEEIIHFDKLTPSQSKEDQIMTFVPLLHLTNQRKIDIEQEKHLAPIYIKMLKEKKSADDENE